MNKGLKTLSSLEKLVDFIASEYNPEKIILFGSYGTRRNTETSDIDLLIIKKTNKRFVDRVVELMQLIRNQFGFEYPVEPFIIEVGRANLRDNAEMVAIEERERLNVRIQEQFDWRNSRQALNEWQSLD